ncbi:hypothetical protein JAO73_20420 [Hymenobacter sp. BT523]|uniref:hypothetical protein n=1 Tax=Hymenobacter sp. BT523 TaxID=2795725 RepID=UPI0018EB5318|nr:hypothetical protein [Hymenobacter sp. BT523]MBJ6111397.1 hypothetical protein [Hymenobacter sp. BT523]
MRLTLSEKLQIFFGSLSFLAGLAFSATGVVLTCFLWPIVDFSSVWFLAQPVAQTSGIITSANLTSLSDGDDDESIWEINYRFQRAGHLYQGHSYSSSHTVAPGTAVQVEYVKNQPRFSRISGTSGAPYPLWALIPTISCLVSGLQMLRKGISYCTQAVAIADDIQVAPAICARVKPCASRSDDEEKIFTAHYTYFFEGREYEYLHEVSLDELGKLNEQEELALQRAAPANAMLIANLPRLVRNRLRLSSFPT